MGLRDRVKSVEIVDDDNIYLTQPQKGLELCSNIISKGELSFKEGLLEIDTMIEEFMAISQLDSNTTGVQTYTELLALREDIVNILTFSKLENHYTVAVGGGFSSGKSTFLNKVLGLKDVLPTDTNPTTSISSYITKGSRDSFVALNNFNNIIKLDKEAIQAISHAFNKKYNVSFSHILKLISIELEELKYDNLVFLDTPGYSKPDSRNSEDNIDENVAREHLRTTDFLIWLLDAQTPISSTDMKFLKSLELKHPILVVLNKADKKTEEDVKAQVEKTRENLINQEIIFYDVVGYSSSKDMEYSPSKDVIKSYLNTIASNTTGTKILKRTTDIFKKYISFYDSQLMDYRTSRGILNKMIMSDSITGEYLDEITALSSQKVKQIKYIEKSKKEVTKLHTGIQEIVAKLLVQNNIDIKEFRKEFVFDKAMYENIKVAKKSSKRYEFPATLKMKNYTELLRYKDCNSIDAVVSKISTIGVFIKILNMEGELMVSRSKILKESAATDIQEIFKVADKVTLRIVDKKKCIVIKN